MFLNKIAQKNMKERFDSYEEVSDSFLPEAFQGRIDLTDRFLSIYNRPTRKRVLFTDPKTPLPSSGVMRHPKTGEVYLLGALRDDARWDVEGGDPYLRMSMLHLVTPSGGVAGQGIQTRRVLVGESQDWLTPVELRKVYMDVEFRTSSSERDVELGTVENYFAWLPKGTDIRHLDQLELGGVKYLVLDVYEEMGMCALRVSKQEDPRLDLFIYRKTKVFNNDTFEYEVTTTKERVTGYIPRQSQEAGWSEKGSEALVAIDTDHILFTPEVDMEIEIMGRRLTIHTVYLQTSHSQWRITVG